VPRLDEILPRRERDPDDDETIPRSRDPPEKIKPTTTPVTGKGGEGGQVRRLESQPPSG
jgi:hypothetical protein